MEELWFLSIVNVIKECILFHTYMYVVLVYISRNNFEENSYTKSLVLCLGTFASVS